MAILFEMPIAHLLLHLWLGNGWQAGHGSYRADTGALQPAPHDGRRPPVGQPASAQHGLARHRNRTAIAYPFDPA